MFLPFIFMEKYFVHFFSEIVTRSELPFLGHCNRYLEKNKLYLNHTLSVLKFATIVQLMDRVDVSPAKFFNNFRNYRAVIKMRIGDTAIISCANKFISLFNFPLPYPLLIRAARLSATDDDKFAERIAHDSRELAVYRVRG